MPALQLTPLATTACSPSPQTGILCSALSRPLPKPFRSPGPPSPYTQISKHQSATLPPPAHCSHLHPSFGPHMEPSHSRAGIRGRCLLPQARCVVGPALTPHLTCLGVTTLGSLPWVQMNGQRWQGLGTLSPSLRPLHCPRTKISSLSTWGRSPGSALPT